MGTRGNAEKNTVFCCSLPKNMRMRLQESREYHPSVSGKRTTERKALEYEWIGILKSFSLLFIKRSKVRKDMPLSTDQMHLDILR
jgi:hypothetical protein